MPANIQEQLKCLNDDRRTTDKMLLDSLFNYFFNNKNWSTTQKKNLGPSDTKLVEQPPPLQKKVYSEKKTLINSQLSHVYYPMFAFKTIVCLL